MIEDHKLVCRILRYVARQETLAPANITIDQILNAFPRRNKQKLEDHIKFATRSSLLGISIVEEVTLDDGAVSLNVEITGITQKGHDYLNDARAKCWKSLLIGESSKNLIVRVLAIVIGGLILACLTRFIPANPPQPVQGQPSIPLDSPTPE